MLRAGRLRHVLVLQSKTTTREADGSEVITWTDEDTVRGSVEPLRGEEFYAARMEGSSTDNKIVIRYRSDVRPEWRVVWGSRTFDVESLRDIGGRQRRLELYAREVW